MAGVTQSNIDTLLTEKARPAKGQRTTTVLPGLDIHIGAAGPGRWCFRYRPRGTDPETGRRYPQRDLTVGTTATHSLREATATVAMLKLRVGKGEDPAMADRAAAASAREATVAARRKAVVDEAARVTCGSKLAEYFAVQAARGRSEKHRREELAQVRLALTSVDLMDAAPSDLTPAHIDKILAACPVGSRALRFGALDRFLRWALRGSNVPPATAALDRHERPTAPKARQRVLTADEIKTIWMAATKPAAPPARVPGLRVLVAFLVSTPCREGEAAAARWADIDFETRCWLQPTSKNGRPHRFPLNDRAIAILTAQRAAAERVAAEREPPSKPADTDLVFPSPRAGKIFGGWSNMKVWFDEKTAGTVAPWRLHDLRRTAATVLGDLGYDDALVDMLLNHTAAGTRSVLTRTYNTAQRWEERGRAMAAWCRWLDTATGERSGDTAKDNVVAMRSAQRKIA